MIKEGEEVNAHNQECVLQVGIPQCHQDWTIHDWYRIIFSDEPKINRFQSDGGIWCWMRDVESQLQVHHVN